MARTIIFFILAAVILASAVFCVSTKRIMRAATALLFVLFGVAGLYFVLDYTFLGAAQISIYAGGITMMYIFAIQLVSKRTLQGLSERWLGKKTILAAAVSLVGLATVGAILLKNQFITQAVDLSKELPVSDPGQRPDVCREVWLCAPLRVHLPLPPGVHHRWSGNSQLI